MSKTTKLPISTRGWAQADSDALHRIMDAALAFSTGSGERIDEFLRLLDAERAKDRPAAWTSWAYADLARVGAKEQMSGWAKRARQIDAVLPSGKRVTRAAVQATVVRDEETGERWHQQSMLVTKTFDELRDKRGTAIRMLTSYRDDIAIYDAYLALAERVPSATTPKEALDSLGVTEDEWLGDVDRRTA